MPAANPENLVYSEPDLAPGGGGAAPAPPDIAAVGVGLHRCGPAARHRSTGRPPGVAAAGSAQQLLPGAPPAGPPTVPSQRGSGRWHRHA